MIIVLKVGQALARELRQIDPEILSPALHGKLDATDALSTLVDSPIVAAEAVRTERGANEVVALYQAMREEHRAHFLSFLHAAGAALAHAAPSVAPPAVRARRGGRRRDCSAVPARPSDRANRLLAGTLLTR